jgi:hypothetical protein
MSFTLFKPLWIASAALVLGSQPSHAQTQAGLGAAGDTRSVETASLAAPANQPPTATLPDRLASCPRSLGADPRPCTASGNVATSATAPNRLIDREARGLLASARAVSSQADEAPRELPTPPFWSARKVAIVSGIGGMVAAGMISWQNEMRLRDQKRVLQGIPSTADALDRWNQQFADAKAIENTRDFWRNVSLGVGGVTLGYWAISAHASRSGRIKLGPGDGGWRVRVSPFHPEISISRSLP